MLYFENDYCEGVILQCVRQQEITRITASNSTNYNRIGNTLQFCRIFYAKLRQ